MAKVDYQGRVNESDIGTIYINGVPFHGVADDSPLGWEEFVWKEQPSRGGTFAFENMDDIDVGLVARCEVNFKYFNIQDFMKFREAIKQRHFQVKFFNVDSGKWEEREMYCSNSERNKLYYFNPALLGVMDFKVKLVATNRDVIKTQTPRTITFDKNNYNISVSSVENVEFGGQYTLPSAPTLSGYTFDHWDTKADGTGWQYKEGQSFTVFKDTTIYPIYKEA